MAFANSITDFIMKRIVQMQRHFINQKNPCVLSCGGIYIPRHQAKKISYQVLNLANEAEPTKVYSDRPSFNSGLYRVLAKEILN